MKKLFILTLLFVFYTFNLYGQWGEGAIGTTIKDSSGQKVDIVQNADDSSTVEDKNGLVTSSLLYGRTGNTATAPLRADSSTNTLQTIDYPHHEIHAGNTYRVQHNQTNIPATGSSGELVIAFFIPDQAKEIHVLWDFIHEGSMTLTIYEDVTFNASAGTDRLLKQSNRNSSNTSVVQGKATGSLVSNYVTVGEESVDSIYSGGTVISMQTEYAARNQSGGGTTRHEIVLKPNANYVFSLRNNETSTQGGQILIEFYEHEPKN